MIRGGTEVAPSNHHGLGEILAPRVADACEGRLGELIWFKADWQRGGAATGTTTIKLPDGRELAVLLKLPVVQRELLWTRRLQDDADSDPVVPRLFASGEQLDDYDLAWILIEKFPHGPLGLRWSDGHIPRMAHAAARFHELCRRYPVDRAVRTEPWQDEVRDAIESVRVNAIADGRRWSAALKSLAKRLDPLVDEWSARPVDEWMHGDLHLANAMCRSSDPTASVALIDLAEVHPGHWVEDAIYLERQLWARPKRLERHNPVKAIAQARRKLGLPLSDGYPRLAAIRRALLAGTAPKFIKSEGHPRHLEACLARLEEALGEVK